MLQAGRAAGAHGTRRKILLTTEALITELPEKDKAPAMPPGGGMGGMGGMDY